MSGHSEEEYQMLVVPSLVTPKIATSEASPKGRRDARRSMDRTVPIMMGLSFVAGIIIALVHHFFYHYWNGKVVGSDSQQKWIIRGGTVLAFGFKACLAIGSGAAYVQYLWMSLRARPYKVRNVDSLIAVLTDATEFASLKLWLGVPFLALPAIFTWVVPLAAIVTPGTLIVSPDLRSKQSTQIVPAIDFQYNPDAFGQLSPRTFDFSRATDDVIRIALAAATSDSILAMNPAQPNSTYTLKFPGPALRCEKAADDDLNFMLQRHNDYESTSGGTLVDYFSWAPSSNLKDSIRDNPPFNTTDFSDPIDRLSWFLKGSAASPGGEQVNILSHCLGDPLHRGPCLAPVFLQCVLHNVTYTVDFTFSSGQQNLAVHPGPRNAPVGQWRYYNAPDLDRSVTNRTRTYMSIMYAFGRIVTGSISSHEGNPYNTYSTLIQSTKLSPLLSSSKANNQTLCQAFEDLFQNITFSLLSSSQFLLDPSNSTQATSATVNTTQTQNIYVYNPLDLYLSYGIALACDIICLAMGFFALFSNGVSYSNHFSTFLRTTRNHELDHLVAESEHTGANPAAEHMKDALISYSLNDDKTAGFALHADQQGGLHL